jgi:hypothetical protein
MTRAWRLVLALLLLSGFFREAAWAEANVRFERGLPRSGNVALGGRTKLVVVEFLDPKKTGLGKAIAALLFKDIFSAVLDQAGAAIVYAPAPASQRPAETAERDLHRAALRIGAEQQGRLVLWGSIEPVGDALILNTALTMLSAGEDPELVVQLTVTRQPVQDVAAEFPWTRFDLPPISIRRAELFNRLGVVGASGMALRAAPEASAAVLRSARPGEILQVRDMLDEWFVISDGGRQVYVDAKPRQDLATGVQLLPRRIAGSADDALHGDSTERSAVLGRLDPQRVYAVLNRRVIDGQAWYHIDAGGRRGWVMQARVAGLQDLAVTNLAVAALRYVFGNPGATDRELRRFLLRPETERTNVNTAGALQMLGVTLLRRGDLDAQGQSMALSLLDRAIEETPYDPAAYNLRAIARLGLQGGLAAVDDLDAALALDPLNGRTRILAAALKRAGESAGPTAIAELKLRDVALQRRIDALLQRFSARGAQQEEPRRLIEDMRRIFEPPRR